MVSAGQWTGAIAASDSFQPDCGRLEVDPSVGVACIGATPWVTNLNVPLDTGDVSFGRRIARRLSARGGGLPRVEAMALPHISGEPACPLDAFRISKAARPSIHSLELNTRPIVCGAVMVSPWGRHVQLVTGVEIACNLLDEARTPVATVVERVRQLAAEEGVQALEGPLGTDAGGGPYVLGLTREALVHAARGQLGLQ